MVQSAHRPCYVRQVQIMTTGSSICIDCQYVVFHCRELTPSEGHPVLSVSWSPSGDQFLCVTGDSQTYTGSNCMGNVSWYLHLFSSLSVAVMP